MVNKFLIASFYIALVVVLTSCGETLQWSKTTIGVTRDGCTIDTNSVYVTLTQERLPNNQIRCTIETLPPPKGT